MMYSKQRKQDMGTLDLYIRVAAPRTWSETQRGRIEMCVDKC